jgi:hypothetical protein
MPEYDANLVEHPHARDLNVDPSTWTQRPRVRPDEPLITYT